MYFKTRVVLKSNFYLLFVNLCKFDTPDLDASIAQTLFGFQSDEPVIKFQLRIRCEISIFFIAAHHKAPFNQVELFFKLHCFRRTRNIEY